jgi:AcrR family transcriptional regulator
MSARMTSLPRGRLRARSADEKAGRQDALIAAGRRALASRSYDEVTMADVAASAGLSKASAYLYFSTKESLFLQLIEKELQAWFETVEAGLKPGLKGAARSVPRLIARSLAGSPVLLDLLTLLHGRIETNLNLEEVTRFKNYLAVSLDRVGSKLDTCLNLKCGAGMKLLLRTHAFTIGLRQMSEPPEIIAKVIAANPHLSGMTPDFETELADTISDWLSALGNA